MCKHDGFLQPWWWRWNLCPLCLQEKREEKARIQAAIEAVRNGMATAEHADIIERHIDELERRLEP